MATAVTARHAEERSTRPPRNRRQHRRSWALPMPLVLHSRQRALQRRKRVGLHKRFFLPVISISIRLAVVAIAV